MWNRTFRATVLAASLLVVAGPPAFTLAAPVGCGRYFKAYPIHGKGDGGRDADDRGSSRSNHHLTPATHHLTPATHHSRVARVHPSQPAHAHAIQPTPPVSTYAQFSKGFDRLYTPPSNLRVYANLYSRLNTPGFASQHPFFANLLNNRQAFDTLTARYHSAPYALFKFSPFLTRVLEGGETAIAMNLPISPGGGTSPNTSPGGTTGGHTPHAVPAPPSAVLLSLGIGTVLVLVRFGRGFRPALVG